MARLRSQPNLVKPNNKDLRQLKGGPVLTGKQIRVGIAESGEKPPDEPIKPNTSNPFEAYSSTTSSYYPQACRCSIQTSTKQYKLPLSSIRMIRSPLQALFPKSQFPVFALSSLGISRLPGLNRGFIRLRIGTDDSWTVPSRRPCATELQSSWYATGHRGSEL